MKRTFTNIMFAIPIILAGRFLYACATNTTGNTTGVNASGFVYSSTINITGLEPATQLTKQKQVPAVPQEMIYIPGGNVHLGADNGTAEETPRVWATVKAFYMDEHEVSVAAFRRFIQATGYKTDADKFGNSGVFISNMESWWQMKEGANWEYPQGPDKAKARDDHPVTQVSWNDASAYAKWAGKRLPSEIEWEHAARNAINSQERYPWGDEPMKGGKWMLNYFQGSFPGNNLNEDGFAFTAPTGSFGKTPLGLADMAGNVWEWCSDNKISYADLLAGHFSKASENEKVMRGGSFLCETSRCHGFRVSSRSFSSPETSLMHIGFRCVKDVAP